MKPELDVGSARAGADDGVDVDELYSAFCADLPADLETTARSFAVRLGLAPSRDVGWSRVFKHAVTLGAPALFAEAMPGVPRERIARATLAHTLSVLEAFGSDRIVDGQIADAPDLRRLLDRMREERDRCLTAIAGEAYRRAARQADERTLDAITRERAAFASGSGISLAAYEDLAAAKQSVGLIAVSALAASAGWTPEAVDAVGSTLLHVALGLQLLDDVADWEDDFRRGGAWIVLLATNAHPLSVPVENDAASLRRFVESSGVQVDVLSRAEAHFLNAEAVAASLGAARLATWAKERAREAGEQSAGERRSPGYVRRLHALAPFVAEVLS
ncbi:MAG TPA: hypothetical protein VHC69_17090 [Polyangiaceae bacterium]|nr:hypothetical protein [Polyangiaceae bacterium]